jgi:hypothetical protein
MLHTSTPGLSTALVDIYPHHAMQVLEQMPDRIIPSLVNPLLLAGAVLFLS